jgi:hypothetical protein
MNVGQAVVADLVTAIRAGDFRTVAALIDWPASGVARMVRALEDVAPHQRAGLARAGLKALRTEGADEPISLTWLAPCLETDAFVSPASTDEEASARSLLDAPEVPPEVDEETRGALVAIAARAYRIDEIRALHCGARTPCLLATGPGINGVVVIRP